MDYMIAYNRFCKANQKKNFNNGLLKSKTQVVKKHKKNGLELHHIKPRSLNGVDAIQNYVLLSRADHVFAHLLLDLALYQRGDFKALNTLSYGSYQLPKNFLSKKSINGIKIKLKFPGQHEFKVFSLKQAALYYACIRRKDITSKNARLASTWAVLKRAFIQKSKYGIEWKLELA